MKKKMIPMLLALALIIGVGIPSANAEAALITNAAIAEQKVQVQESIRVALTEQLTLLQMEFIQLLENRIAFIKAK